MLILVEPMAYDIISCVFDTLAQVDSLKHATSPSLPLPLFCQGTKEKTARI